jgi:glycerol-3-phosphate acyltransferase PlsX
VIRVGLDAMGGDLAPATEIEGALAALRDLPPSFLVQLVGRPEIIEAELARHPGHDPTRLEIIPAAEVIGPGEKPLQAIRQKRKSSIAIGLGQVAKGGSDAFVSAGNTGAMLAGSTLLLGLHDGVERATVGALLPTSAGPVLLLDAGANVDCSPRELEGFAALGTVYMRDVQQRENPTVGLLNVGEEDEKGGAVVRAAHELLKANAHHLNYVGNIEGRDILAGHSRLGRVDVIVCDGFVGNVVLKFYESVLHLVMHLAREGAPDMWERKEIRAAFRMLDYSQYGGSPLLGVQGISIICHGASNANAIKNAIRVAVQSVESHLSQHIAAEFTPGQVADPA